MKRSIAFVVAFVTLGIVVGVLIFQQIDAHRAPAIVIDDPRVDAQIVVSVEGAVRSPGTYTLTADARIQNALTAAGGPTDDADLSGLNLAARLSDEEQLVIPSKSQRASNLTPSAVPAVSNSEPTSAVSTAKININTADAATLDSLPGIGPALATAIIEYREQNGPFAAVDELAAVKGISLAMVDTMRDLITV